MARRHDVSVDARADRRAVRRSGAAVTGPREPEPAPWHPTPRLRFWQRGGDIRLQQLWQRDVAHGQDWIEWRDVPVETADRVSAANPKACPFCGEHPYPIADGEGSGRKLECRCGVVMYRNRSWSGDRHTRLETTDELDADLVARWNRRAAR
jgi:hypothetical protein